MLTTQRPRPPSYLLVAGILQMVLRNGIARAIHKPTPCSVVSLNDLRTQLLQDPFFDPHHAADELAAPVLPSRILLADLVVLLATLMRVLMRPGGPLTEGEQAERSAVRNEVLNQPFFDRGRPASRNPFAEIPFEDEGCFA
ncbi:hypothetical protein LTR08_008713 [Meristemomyces frigidus]|nr:hypothetical protein LTR08_008713 [Meristemomyces frigidus]